MPKGPTLTDPGMEPLFRAVSFFASECSDFTPQLLKVFLFVATHNGCRLDDIGKGLGMTSAAVTHMVNWLSDGQYKNHKPLGWVVKRQDVVDHRAKNVLLTRLGQAVVDNLKAQLYPEV